METSFWNDREVIWMPNPGPQTLFLASPAREVLYGGAAGGGKTDAILAGAIRYADHPLHRAILFRRTRPQLQEVIDRSQVLYPEIIPGAYWHEKESRWKLPAGGYIQMGYAEHEDDIMAFKTFEYNYIGFDELTSFTERMYKFMFSRNRSKSRDLPLMVRAASNPGDIGHDWVFNRFIKQRFPYKIYETRDKLDVGGKNYSVSFTRQFVPAKVSDNPSLPDPEGYIAGLLEMGEEGNQYLHGLWVRIGGMMFKTLPEEIPAMVTRGQGYYVIMAMDYGLNDPTSVHWLVVYDNGNVDIAGELYVNEVSVDHVAELIKKYEAETLRLRTPAVRVGDPKMFARDPTSMQSVASMLEDNGIHIEKANNDRVAGWVQIQRMIFSHQLRRWQGRAPELERVMPAMARHPTKPNDIKDHQEDHALDSLRYGAMEVYAREHGEVTDIDATLSTADRVDKEFEKMIDDLRNQGNRSEYIEGLGEW